MCIRDSLDPPHQFHYEVRAAGLGHTGVEDPGDVRVVHHREGLALGLKAGHHLPAIHSELEDLEGDAAFNRLALLGHPDFTKAAFTELLEQLVAADSLGRG